MDFGSMMSDVMIGAGQSQIAGAEQQQRLANIEDTRAQTQMRQMQALAMKQELDDKQNAAADMRTGMSTVAGGIKTQEDIVKGATAAMTIAASKGNFAEVKVMEDLIGNANKEIKATTDAAVSEKQAKAETAGRAALAYQENPTPAAAAEVVRNAIAAGVPVQEIPPSTDQKAFARFVDTLPGKARSVERATEFKQAKDKAEADREERIRHDKETEAARLESIRSTAASQANANATRQLAIATMSADRARAEEAKALLKSQSNASARGHIGLREQAISDLIIRNSAQGVRVIDNMMSVPGSAAQSLFTKISDGSLQGSLTKAGGNMITPEADQAVTAIGAEMGLVVGQVVTAGAGRGAALPIVESFQKMTTPQAGDTPLMKVMRLANAGEIMRLELKNIPPGSTDELEESRQNMKDFLGKLPTTKQVLKMMPDAEREHSMGQYMDIVKKSTEMVVKGKELAATETKPAERTGETKTLNGITYHKNARGGWEQD